MKEQVLSFTVPEKSKERTNWRAKKGDILGFLASILLHNIKKNERGPFGNIKKFSEKMKNENCEHSFVVPKNVKGGRFSLVWFCMLRLKNLAP